MQSAHYAIRTHALIVLTEVDGPDLLVELPLAEALKEIASGITENARLDDEYSLNGCLYYVHSD